MMSSKQYGIIINASFISGVVFGMVVASIICVAIFHFDWLRRAFFAAHSNISRSSVSGLLASTGTAARSSKSTSFLLTEEHLKLIRTRKWTELQKWAEENKKLVNNLRDGRGNSMLHYAVVYRPPAAIVRTLCEETTLARCKNIDCELPLHWTFRAGARLEILDVLLEHCPEASIAVNKMNKSAFDMVTMRQPRRSSGESKRGFPVTISHSADDYHQWRVLMMLLKAASSASNKSKSNKSKSEDEQEWKAEQPFNPLHVAVGLNIVPLDFILLILQRIQSTSTSTDANAKIQQFSSNDDNSHQNNNNNNTACTFFSKEHTSSYQKKGTEEEDSTITTDNNDNEEHELLHEALHTRDPNNHGRLPLHIAAATHMPHKRARLILSKLLTMNPKAARIADSNGHLPLTLAIRSGKRWEGCIQFLLEVEPRALCVRDHVTRMVPFMVAASAALSSSSSSSAISSQDTCTSLSLQQSSHGTLSSSQHKRMRRRGSKSISMDFDLEMERLEQLNVVYLLLKANPSACSMYIN